MSVPRPRLTRPQPEREGPIRNAPPAPGATVGAAADQSLRAAGRVAELSAAAVRDTVDLGVRTAYAVIDEYMRLGREAAERYGPQSAWRNDMSDQRFTYNEGPMAWGPFWPFVAPWMQMMQTWTSAMSGGFPGAGPGPQAGWSPMGMRPAPRVCVRVSSPVPVVVTPALAPGADATPLVVDPLQVDHGSAALPLDAATIVTTTGHVDVTVTIPAGQAAGTYRGAIRQAGAARLQVGELVVQVEQAAAAGAAQ